MNQGTFFNISEASRMLGVSEAALRQWTDEGKVKAFITPGGHRRYSKAELEKLLSSHSKTLGIKDLVSELEETAGLHREIAHQLLSSAPWYDKLSRESQEHFAEIGRRMLSLIIKYVTEPSKREETTNLARQAGHETGKILAELGLPLTDSIEAFLLHRDPIMNVATHLIKKGESFSGRIVEAIPLVNRIMDVTLVALVIAHQQYQDISDSKNKGAIAT